MLLRHQEEKRSNPYVGNTHVDLFRNPSLGSYSRRHNFWTSFGSSNIVKILDRYWIEVAIPSMINPENISRCDIQRNRACCE